MSVLENGERKLIAFDRSVLLLDGSTEVTLGKLVTGDTEATDEVYELDIVGVGADKRRDLGRAYVNEETLEVWDRQVR